jgi:class 3 adenylate cyclase
MVEQLLQSATQVSDLSTARKGAERSKPRILLVDDEPDTLHLIRKILQADGYEIMQAQNGLEALEMVEAHHPDLILLDVVMPVMDGIAVLKELRKTDPITGVIMVSALSSEQLVVQSMLEGADDFVGKPFTLKTFRVRIRQSLEKARLRRENITLQQELRLAHDKIRTILLRYMAGPVAERLLTSPTLPILGGERQIITVLFMDFCDFTPLSHGLEPDHMLRILNEHLGLVTDIILEEEGTIDKFMGDGVMALFNAPVPQADHALRAARCAARLRDRIIQWGEMHSPALKVRVGVHTGEAVVGNIGTQEFMNYTAIGDAVNIAKRLQEESIENGVFISGETVSRISAEQLRLNHLPPQKLKGILTPIDCYQLDGLA